MSRIITQEQAQALIGHADGYADPEYTELDRLLDTNPVHLQRLAWRMAEQIHTAAKIILAANTAISVFDHFDAPLSRTRSLDSVSCIPISLL